MTTVILAVPVAAIRAADTSAVNCVGDRSITTNGNAPLGIGVYTNLSGTAIDRLTFRGTAPVGLFGEVSAQHLTLATANPTKPDALGCVLDKGVTVTIGGTAGVSTVVELEAQTAGTGNIDLQGGQANGVVLDLINGDVNGDNNVNLADLNAISAAWRTTPGSAKWNPNADLNGDGRVNLADWNIVSKNWRKLGDQ